MKYIKILIISIPCFLLLLFIISNNSEEAKENNKMWEAYHKSSTTEELNNDSKLYELAKCLKPKKYDGIDVSHHNGNINWKKVANNKNIKYVYIKATEGKSFIDPKYKTNIKNARNNKLKVGSYLFYRGNVPAIKQWKLFNKVVEKNQQDLVPMLDVEWGAYKKPLKEIVPELRIIIDNMRQKYGKYPLIYCDDDQFIEMHQYFPKCPIMVQNFLKYLPHDLATPDTEELNYTIWQYSERGKVSGIPKLVDLSKLHDNNSLNKILL